MNKRDKRSKACSLAALRRRTRALAFVERRVNGQSTKRTKHQSHIALHRAQSVAEDVGSRLESHCTSLDRSPPALSQVEDRAPRYSGAGKPSMWSCTACALLGGARTP